MKKFELTTEPGTVAKQEAGGSRSAASCSGLFDPPPATEYTFLSLGAGVQSSCLALMAARGELGPMPDAAIFADTQAEPKAVMEWLDWLEAQLPFPVYRVTAGNLAEKAVELKQHQTKPIQYAKWLIPAFSRSKDGSIGILGRKCTQDYKVQPLRKKVRELAGIKHGQKEVTVTQWIGISWDELQRMKASRDPWCQMRWPLIERRMTRRQCLEWMESNGYPEPPRSACTFCPFHSNDEWRRLRDNDQSEFDDAVRFERHMQEVAKQDGLLRDVPYLHRACVPLDQVDLQTDIEKGQAVFDFQSECEGMCGI